MPDIIYPLTFLASIIFAVFLFWRAGRHELIDSKDLFDILAVSIPGIFFGARFFDFLIHPQIYNWQINRLIFFNKWGGFDLIGGFLGALLITAIFLRFQKINFWQVFDLAAAPISFGLTITSIASKSFYQASGYFLIFWFLKRLAAKKRHKGFFACFFLVSASILNIAVSFLQKDEIIIMGPQGYKLLVSLLLLISGFSWWHILARRSPKDDIKSIMAAILLAIFRTRRVITSIEEAGLISKSIIFAPPYLAKGIYFLLKLVLREITLGLKDFVLIFKTRR